MSFPQFAFNNIRRNGRAYIAFFLSSVVMVMIFFAYAMFIYHPSVKAMPMGETTSVGMGIASGIVYVFAIFFVIYSIGAFLKSRNKEFGILTILGAAPGQIRRLIMLENMLIGAVSIVAGIAGGMLLSKLFLMVATRFIGMEDLPFYFPLKAIGLTVGAFMLLFVGVSLFTLAFIGNRRALDLLTGTSRPKKEPRVSWLFSLIGAGLLATGFIALYDDLQEVNILIAAISGIAGTYFFYSQLSVLVMRLLKRSRRWGWKGTRLLWVSEMAYKIKDNARMLFMVTVVIALASMSAVVILSLDQDNREKFRESEFPVQYRIYDAKEGEDFGIIDSVFKQAGVNYERAYVHYDWGVAEGSHTALLSLSDYNRINALRGKQAEQLASGKGIFIDSRNSAEMDSHTTFHSYAAGEMMTLQQESGSTQVRIAKSIKDAMYWDTMFALSVLVLPDEDFSQVGEKNSGANVLLYSVPSWGKDIPANHSPEARISRELQALDDDMQMDPEKYDFSGYMATRYANFENTREATSIITFLGVMIGLVFSISSASFLYFRLHTDLEADGRMVHGLSKIGLSFQEMKRSSTVQIAILFFFPMLTAIVETLVVVKPFLTQFGVTDYTVPVLSVFGAFLGLQTLYFFIIRGRYISSLRKKMV